MIKSIMIILQVPVMESHEVYWVQKHNLYTTTSVKLQTISPQKLTLLPVVIITNTRKKKQKRISKGKQKCSCKTLLFFKDTVSGVYVFTKDRLWIREPSPTT